MSKPQINQYYTNVDKAIQFGKTKNETSIRNYFWMLLNEYARKLNYEVITEVAVMGTKGKKVYPDGAVKTNWGLDIGLWESKDEKDDIEAEIDAKIKKGYPLTNILFEDSNIAVLFQRGQEVDRTKVRDADKFDDILTQFIGFKSETVYKFEEAIEKFKADIPIIVETLRKRIIENRDKNKNFVTVQNTFLELCKTEINPSITLEDIREMMIQHILTSDIFNKIFDDPDFHRHNTIAAELEKLTETLFVYAERRNLLHSIEHYYEAINATAAGITDHHEKQKFLKVLYENFYKVYNPKAADRLGVVYTPNEIVQFMVKAVDYLLHKHFGRTLADKNVEILDPSTGTGTYICEIIEHAIPKHLLDYKYKNEIFANEVAILPYYIANLNIEYTFKQKMDYYAEFPNLCFVDTLDNVHGLVHGMGAKIDNYKTTGNLFAISSENSERIKRQNTKKISVIITNPPYNANQLNENENNKNREYPFIDKRIKDTYIKHSTAQKTKVYDMYARFYRWAMDRLENNGVLAMITNRSFIDSRTFDGFRKCVQEEFSHCYIIDTKSDVRANPKIAGTTHNVFGIQTGVAIMFLIKKEKKEENCIIEYISLDDCWKKEDKLDWLKVNTLDKIKFETVQPDIKNNWTQNESDFYKLTPIIDKQVKSGSNEKAIFKLYCWGNSSNRDEWVYDIDKTVLLEKTKFMVSEYLNLLDQQDFSFITTIKWSNDLKTKFNNKKITKFNNEDIIKACWRPYTKLFFFANKLFNDRLTDNHYLIFGKNLDRENKVLMITCHPQIPFIVHVVTILPDAGYGSRATQMFPLFRYDKSGNRINNITDWSLQLFQSNYYDANINKENIFNYVYSVLHNPNYSTKYELNLKNDFPHLPFYKDFWKWSNWGKQLMDLHINYETVEPYNLKVIHAQSKVVELKQKELFAVAAEPEAMYKRQPKVKAKLKADKETGKITLDENTSLEGIPATAWQYKLGNRSALEWILDQYKEKKPSDPTIAEKFNTYRFADYKEQVIDLLKRVCTVSVETMKIVGEMEKERE